MPGTPAAGGAGRRLQLQDKEAGEGRVWHLLTILIKEGTKPPRRGTGKYRGTFFPAYPTQLKGSTGSVNPCVLFFWVFFYVSLFLRERERESKGGAERKGDRGSEAGSTLLKWRTQIHEVLDHDLS